MASLSSASSAAIETPPPENRRAADRRHIASYSCGSGGIELASWANDRWLRWPPMASQLPWSTALVRPHTAHCSPSSDTTAGVAHHGQRVCAPGGLHKAAILAGRPPAAMIDLDFGVAPLDQLPSGRRW